MRVCPRNGACASAKPTDFLPVKVKIRLDNAFDALCCVAETIHFGLLPVMEGQEGRGAWFRLTGDMAVLLFGNDHRSASSRSVVAEVFVGELSCDDRIYSLREGMRTQLMEDDHSFRIIYSYTGQDDHGAV